METYENKKTEISKPDKWNIVVVLKYVHMYEAYKTRLNLTRF